MARQTAWVLALVLTCASSLLTAGADDRGQGRAEKTPGSTSGKDQHKPQAAATPTPSDGERRKWWLYDRAELGITDQQSAAINQIFESTISQLRETHREWERAEEELSRTIKEHKADLSAITILIDRVESARSQNTKLRVLMLYRMHLLLSPEQRVKLEALRARRDAARKDKESPAGHRRHP